MFGKDNSSKPSTGTSANEGALNIIAKGTQVTGNISTEGDLRIEGKIIGEVTCKAKLVLGNLGIIEGNVDAKTATISGEIKGTVIIKDTLTITETGKISGDVFTEKIIIQLGGYFSGNCKMADSENRGKAILKPNSPIFGKLESGTGPN